MTTDLDILEVLRATLDALDKLVEGQLRSAGSVESQRAANLAQRARICSTASRCVRSSARPGEMPELHLARDYLARGLAYLTDEKHPIRADVNAQLPPAIEAARAVVVAVGKLIETQHGG